MEGVLGRTNSTNLRKTTDTHRKLRTARRSIRTHLKWLYTYKEYPNLEKPNTTNLLEGLNSQLKRTLSSHNGMNEADKKKFIDGFLNIKKSDGIATALPNVHHALIIKYKNFINTFSYKAKYLY